MGNHLWPTYCKDKAWEAQAQEEVRLAGIFDRTEMKDTMEDLIDVRTLMM